jgi:hypothetical protein
VGLPACSPLCFLGHVSGKIMLVGYEDDLQSWLPRLQCLKLHKFTAVSCSSGVQGPSIRYDQCKIFFKKGFLWTMTENDPVSAGFSCIEKRGDF